MSKQINSNLNRKSNFNANFTLFPEKYKDYIFIGLIIISVFVFFGGVVTSYEIAASDNFASISFKTYLKDAHESGVFPQWVPYIFSGMPSYSSMLITGDRYWDVAPMIFFGFTKFMGEIFANDSVRVIQFYIIFGIGMFLLMRAKKFNSEIAFITAIAAVFSTGIIHWVMIGHNTKPITIAMLPFIFLLMEKIRERFSILFSVLLIIAVHLFFESVHIQMMFYSALAIGIYIALELINRFATKNEPMSIVRVIGVLLVAGGLAFLMSSDRYLAVQEYTPYSVRGSSPITHLQGDKADDKGGNTYEYATEWSFSPQEMVTFLVPNFYGFGKLPYSGPETGNKEYKVPTYWGQKVFEDVAPYMGIFIFFMGIFGFVYYRKDVFVQSLFAVSIFLLFLSFGKNLSVIYDIFFYYIPSFNKFRAPSMALGVMQFAFPILAGYGIKAVLECMEASDRQSKKYITALLHTSLTFLGIGFIVMLTAKGTYIDSLTHTGNQTFQNVAKQIVGLKEFVWSAMIGDWMINGFILLAFALIVYMFYHKKINGNLFYSTIILLLFVDLWRVGWRPLEISERDTVKDTFQKTDVVQFLEQDKSIFRIADFVLSQSSPNMPAYFRLESVGGYHPAKLRVYQDLLDVADNGSTSYVTNPFLWNLLNVKYIVSDQQLQAPPVFQSQQLGAFVYQNPAMAERVFFVDSVAVEKPLEILKLMKEGKFDIKKIAYLEKSLNTQIEPIQEGASAKIIEKKNESMKIKVNATGNNLLFISEIYFPLWTAKIDGKDIEINKTNYAFRSIVVPKGEHTIELTYHSKGFETGKTLSIASNILVGLMLLFGIFWEQKLKKQGKDNLK
ncbi:MAG TPA: YfhO family protein [Candidatus Kapabacteria bacterium]|nr:YfhO family protein [Candidatus Kapabacteria bacterium]